MAPAFGNPSTPSHTPRSRPSSTAPKSTFPRTQSREGTAFSSPKRTVCSTASPHGHATSSRHSSHPGTPKRSSTLPPQTPCTSQPNGYSPLCGVPEKAQLLARQASQPTHCVWPWTMKPPQTFLCMFASCSPKPGSRHTLPKPPAWAEWLPYKNRMAVSVDSSLVMSCFGLFHAAWHSFSPASSTPLAAPTSLHYPPGPAQGRLFTHSPQPPSTTTPARSCPQMALERTMPSLVPACCKDFATPRMPTDASPFFRLWYSSDSEYEWHDANGQHHSVKKQRVESRATHSTPLCQPLRRAVASASSTRCTPSPARPAVGSPHLATVSW